MGCLYFGAAWFGIVVLKYRRADVAVDVDVDTDDRIRRLEIRSWGGTDGARGGPRRRPPVVSHLTDCRHPRIGESALTAGGKAVRVLAVLRSWFILFSFALFELLGSFPVLA